MVPLAVGTHGTADYRNTASHGGYVYVEIRPARLRAALYTLHLTAVRR